MFMRFVHNYEENMFGCYGNTSAFVAGSFVFFCLKLGQFSFMLNKAIVKAKQVKVKKHFQF